MSEYSLGKKRGPWRCPNGHGEVIGMKCFQCELEKVPVLENRIAELEAELKATKNQLALKDGRLLIADRDRLFNERNKAQDENKRLREMVEAKGAAIHAICDVGSDLWHELEVHNPNSETLKRYDGVIDEHAEKIKALASAGKETGEPRSDCCKALAKLIPKGHDETWVCEECGHYCDLATEEGTRTGEEK